MDHQEIIALIDIEIAQLQRARSILSSIARDTTPSQVGRGTGSGLGSRRKRRGITPEGRARIAAAQKRRWAALKATKK